jgi:hypothetical protein
MWTGEKEWQWQQLELRWQRILKQEKFKVSRGIDAVVHCETPSTFYWVEEGGEFFNTYVLGKIEERVGAYFRRGKEHVEWLLVPAWRGGLRMQWRGDDWHSESGGVWIDPSWKTISHASWAERLFASDTSMKIKRVTEMELARKERFLVRKKIVRRLWAAVV